MSPPATAAVMTRRDREVDGPAPVPAPMEAVEGANVVSFEPQTSHLSLACGQREDGV